MKLAIVLACVVAAASAASPTRPVSEGRSAVTLKAGYDANPDGSYNYFYETNNGIAAQEQGTPRDFGGNPPIIPSVAQGSYSWTSPEGQHVAVTYVADEKGYQPQGDVIPTPHPQIVRALDFILKHS